MRTRIMLRCTECNEEDYRSSRNKKNVPDRLELKKYCPRCNKNTLHREKR